MKSYIKKWLGIAELNLRIEEIQKRVGKEKEVKSTRNLLLNFFSWDFEPIDNSLTAKSVKIRQDFEELDKKFDALERYLQIEYYKEDKETQVYDWADKKHSEGFRKTAKTYEQMKEIKEERTDEDED